jgi:hypothetical protein
MPSEPVPDRITTTASIGQPVTRCGACDRVAPGGLLVSDGNGKMVAVCHARVADRELMGTMVVGRQGLVDVPLYTRKPTTLTAAPRLSGELHEIISEVHDAEEEPVEVEVAFEALPRKFYPASAVAFDVSGARPIGSHRGRRRWAV